MFSVCMPVYNRGKTIYRALESVKNQKFKDFELIIYDNHSKDNSVKEINKFIKANRALKIKFIKGKRTLPNCEDWNVPLSYVKGRYIAFLEGDDQFKENHLSSANRVFYNHPYVGIWTDLYCESKNGFSVLYSKMLFPPPSQTIFINFGFEYDTDNYLYSPEMQMWTDILRLGFKIHFNKYRTTIRDRSAKDMRYPYKILRDRFTFLKEYSDLKLVRFVKIIKFKNYFVTYMWLLIFILNTTRKYGLKYGINIIREHYHISLQ